MVAGECYGFQLVFTNAAYFKCQEDLVERGSDARNRLS